MSVHDEVLAAAKDMLRKGLTAGTKHLVRDQRTTREVICRIRVCHIKVQH